MATPYPRFVSMKLLLLYALYCFLSQLDQSQNQINSRSNSYFAQALLYHKYQPQSPVLARTNRQQPHAQQQQLQLNATSDSYYPNYQAAGFNRQQQQQPQQQPARQEQQISYLRDSSEDEVDSYGCPAECHCNKIAQIADCSNKNLTRVPSAFPKDIKRIRLERNNITEVGPYAFQNLKRLQRIDLSNNNLYRIDPLAFSGGLQALNSLILYSNKLEYLPVKVFSELNQLQLLLLNANSLQTIHKDLFQSLTNLNLLSLYDNNIVSLTSGTFDGLKSIKTIHLGKNPLNCDCQLRWLVDYFEANPVETSEARCESPGRVQGKKLSQLSKSELKCQEQPVKAPPPPQDQAGDPLPGSCPAGCVCNGSIVDCSRVPAGQLMTSESAAGPSGGLWEVPDVPDDLPVYVARVHINDNRIKRIRQTGLFRKLANSQKLDLGNNKIVDIEDNAINGHLPNGQKPERVIFVLLENQHCDAQSAARRPQTGSSEEPSQQTRFAQTDGRTRAQDPYEEDPCAMAPKVNEPQFDSPCYNGGMCKALSNRAAGSNFTCQCQAGFGGPLCEVNLDDCVDHQCQNGAMCVDGINSYKCICRDPTTSGEFCEQLNSNSISSTSKNNMLFNPPYATNSANSIAPLALPMIAPSSPPAGLQQQFNGEASNNQQPQILARSADFMRGSDDLATNSLQAVPTGKPMVAPCHRVTTSRYFDDGNGCQSVRLLKMSECAGGCGDPKTNGCCVASKIKRRRIHMQCSDGASYVKVIDLVKKCTCSQDASCPANGDPFSNPTTTTTTTPTPTATTADFVPPTSGPKTIGSAGQYYKYSTAGEPSESHQKKPRYHGPPLASGRLSQRYSTSYNTSQEQDSLLRLDAVE